MAAQLRGHRPTLSLDVAAPRPNASTGTAAGPQSAVLPGRSAVAAHHTHRPQPPSPSTIEAAETSQPFALQSIFAHLADVRALQGALVKEHIALESAENSTWPGARGAADGRDDGRKATAQAYEALRVDFAKRQDGVERVMGRLDELAEAIRCFDQVSERVSVQRPAPRPRSNSEPASPEGVARAGATTPPPR